jgi:hypothetical protein
MILVTFISIHFVIICDIILWRTYETHPALSLKSGCDSLPMKNRWRGPQRTLSGCGTKLSGVHQTVWQQSDPTVDCRRPQRLADMARAPDCLGRGQIQRSTATDPNGRLTWQASDTVRCALDCSVCQSTESCCFLSND